MATIKSEYYRFNGVGWDLHYFKTTADLIVETVSYKVLTADERTRIAAAAQLANTNQTIEFGGSTQYIRLAYSGTSKAFIKHGGGAEQEVWTNANFNPGDYLPLVGGTLTNDLMGTVGKFTTRVETPQIFVDVIASDGSSISFTGVDTLNFDEAVLRNISQPFLGKDAANKEYVDNLVAEGVKPLPPVKCATTQNITLSGLTTIDGYVLVAGDRVLVKNQTTKSQNGIYAAYATAWVKLTNSDKGYIVFVENGTTYNDWKFYCENLVFEDVPQYNWFEYSKVDTITAGGGLIKTGTTISVNALGITNAMLAGSIEWSKLLNTAAADNASASYDTWAELTAATTSKTLLAHISMALAAIGKLRGTANYNTNNAETIAGAYTLANTKSKNELGSAVPTATAGYNAGDLYFRTLSSS